MKLNFLRSAGKAAAFGLIALVLLGLGCQSKLIYYPRPAGADLTQRLNSLGARRLNYQTSEGRQTAYYVPPRQGNAAQPEFIWILTAGNGSLATDWLGELPRWSPRFGWLLVDYPGYGECEGSPNPGRIRDNYRAAFAALAADLGTTPEKLAPHTGAFGQSLGAAAALDGMVALGLKRALILCPFTSLQDMAKLVVGTPASWLITHRYDNRARLRELAAAGGIKIVVYHGSDDEVIPVAQGRELAELHPDLIEFHEVKNGRHNDLTRRISPQIGTSLEKLSAP